MFNSKALIFFVFSCNGPGRCKLRPFFCTKKPRLQASKQRRVEQDEPKSINFVINDNIVYDEPSDFKSPASRKLFAEYQKLSQELQTLSAQLVDRRQQYAKANAQAKRRMTAELKKMEQQEELLTLKVHRLEKDIRMSEAKNNK